MLKLEVKPYILIDNPKNPKFLCTLSILYHLLGIRPLTGLRIAKRSLHSSFNSRVLVVLCLRHNAQLSLDEMLSRSRSPVTVGLLWRRRMASLLSESQEAYTYQWLNPCFTLCERFDCSAVRDGFPGLWRADQEAVMLRTPYTPTIYRPGHKLQDVASIERSGNGLVIATYI